MQGIQLDRFERVWQPMIQRQIQHVLSMQAEDLSAGQGYSQEAHPRASNQKMIHMGATGGIAIFRVDIPVFITICLMAPASYAGCPGGRRGH